MIYFLETKPKIDIYTFFKMITKAIASFSKPGIEKKGTFIRIGCCWRKRGTNIKND